MSDDRLLGAAEIAAFLNVPKNWVLDRARAGQIRHVRLGRYVRFDRPAVLAWLDQCQQGGQHVKLRKHRPEAKR